MLINTFSQALGKYGFYPMLSWAPDAGDAGGGTATVVDDDDDDDSGSNEPEKKYTDKDIEEMVTKRLRRSNKDLSNKEKKIKELEDKLSDIMLKIDDKLEEEPDNTPVGDAEKDAFRKQQGHWELQKTKFEAKLDELQKELESAKTQLTQAVSSRLDMERDLEIDKALSKIGCIDIENARILIRGHVKYDEANEEWYYEKRNGSILTVPEGVESELPDYLRPSEMRKGGSGQTGGSPKVAKLNSQIKDLDAQLAHVLNEYKKHPTSMDLAVKASKIRKEKKALEDQIRS